MIGNWSGDTLKGKFNSSSGGPVDSIKMNMGFGSRDEGEKKVSGILVLALVCFLIFVILTIGSFVYSLTLERKISALEVTFNTQRDTFKIDVIRSINNFSRQTEGIKKLINEKSDVAVALRQSSELAHPDTQYTRLSLQRTRTDTYNLSISAAVSSLTSYLQQLRTISRSRVFGESGVVTGTRVIDGKKVIFSFNSPVFISKQTDEGESNRFEETYEEDSEANIDSTDIDEAEFDESDERVSDGGGSADSEVGDNFEQ